MGDDELMHAAEKVFAQAEGDEGEEQASPLHPMSTEYGELQHRSLPLNRRRRLA
jgi:hypothetical protein